jgi:hypothetical protein
MASKPSSCSEAFYSIPSALEALANSHGVVVTEQRFRTQVVAGHESPGPIFFADTASKPRGGVMLLAPRFTESPPPVSPPLSPTKWSPGVSPCPVGGTPAASRCTFGKRTMSSSPWLSSSSGVHTYHPERESRSIEGGPLGRAPRRSAFLLAGSDSETLPGPGHFDLPEVFATGGFHLGRKVRRAQSSTPGPGAYDIRRADDLLRRKRR